MVILLLENIFLYFDNQEKLNRECCRSSKSSSQEEKDRVWTQRGEMKRQDLEGRQLKDVFDKRKARDKGNSKERDLELQKGLISKHSLILLMEM